MNNPNASIRILEIDLAGDDTEVGRLLILSRIFLSDDSQDGTEYTASLRLRAHYRVFLTGLGSADYDKSSFYTFSKSYAYQREKKLDNVRYDKRTAADDVCLLRSPA